MDQARYWMWNDQNKVFSRSSTVHSSYHDSWEEQAFAEDASGALGNCVWPPRSYSCSFCRREFRSAQALGGHMNVHRRDRARLKQSPNAVEISHRHYHHQNPCTPLAIQYPSQLCTLSYHGYHDQKAISPLSVSLATSLPFSLNGHNLEAKLKRDLVKPDSLLSSTKLVRSRSPETDPDGCEDEARTTKRRRRDSCSSPLAREFNLGTKSNRPSSTVEELHRIFEVPSSIEELDLELRLGSKPKIN